MSRKKPGALHPLRDFVRHTDGRLGLIVANDTCGGVLRGHADVWFGEIRDDNPVVRQVIVSKLRPVERPIACLEGSG